MKLYNTLTKQKEEFVPVHEGKVGMYVCGPTVYNFIHIGNARPMIVFDTVRRYMEYKGYEVNFVSNFTDVDDKIIKKSIEEGVSAEEVSERYIKECKKDMAGMNVKPATTNPLATQEIDGMIDMIKTLIDKGYAYEKNGTVYYRTRRFEGKVATAKVNMGCPVLEAADIPMDISALKDYKAVYKDILSNAKDTGLSKVAVKALSEVTNAVVAEKIEVNGGIYEITGVSMGNPHGIVYLDKDIDIKKFAIEQIGPHFESHMAFPERVNTEFIQVVDRKNLNMRVWERGSGETLACGTGACASLVATVLNGMCDIDATLHLLGGDLNISWDTESGNVYMEGPATTVFTGTIEI